MRAYHFVADKLRDGQAIPADGVWLEHDGVIVPCLSGLYASVHPFDALTYALGNTLCIVELEGETVKHGQDKIVGRRRMIVKRIDAAPLLREFARWAALQVIDLWDAPEVVRQYLTTGDESLRAAAGAACDAACDAAWAAWHAARDACDAERAAAWAAAAAVAGAAAEVAQREKFAQMVNAAFEVTP